MRCQKTGFDCLSCDDVCKLVVHAKRTAVVHGIGTYSGIEQNSEVSVRAEPWGEDHGRKDY